MLPSATMHIRGFVNCNTCYWLVFFFPPSMQDLSYVDFSYACLKNVFFSRANLQCAKFRVGSNVQYCLLSISLATTDTWRVAKLFTNWLSYCTSFNVGHFGFVEPCWFIGMIIPLFLVVPINLHVYVFILNAFGFIAGCWCWGFHFPQCNFARVSHRKEQVCLLFVLNFLVIFFIILMMFTFVWIATLTDSLLPREDVNSREQIFVELY